MKTLYLSIILLILSIPIFGQNNTCSTASLFNEGFFIITPPDSNVTICFEFEAPTDTINFEFIPFVTGAGAICNGLLEIYTIYDAITCDSLDSGPDGSFQNLIPENLYVVCYNVQCTSGGTIGLIITTELTTLPVEMISFDSRVEYNTVKLNWVTASEINNDYFNVYTSIDLENWELIGTVNGSGSSQMPITYSLTHEDPKNGSNYYMIKQIDFNGEEKTYGWIVQNFYKKDKVNDTFQKYTILGQEK